MLAIILYFGWFWSCRSLPVPFLLMITTYSSQFSLYVIPHVIPPSSVIRICAWSSKKIPLQLSAHLCLHVCPATRYAGCCCDRTRLSHWSSRQEPV